MQFVMSFSLRAKSFPDVEEENVFNIRINIVNRLVILSLTSLDYVSNNKL